MAKDDYHVLAYRLLAYLYACLRQDEIPDPTYLSYDTKAFPIGEAYWNYLLRNLYSEGLLEGVVLIPVIGSEHQGVRLMQNLCITPKGIAYLEDNSTMQKARKFLKNLKEIVPGI